MGIPVGNKTLCTLFVDDQEIKTADEEDATELAGAIYKIENNNNYLVVREDAMEDLNLGKITIKPCKSLKYLSVTLSSSGRNKENISNKIAQGK